MDDNSSSTGRCRCRTPECCVTEIWPVDQFHIQVSLKEEPTHLNVYQCDARYSNANCWARIVFHISFVYIHLIKEWMSWWWFVLDWGTNPVRSERFRRRDGVQWVFNSMTSSVHETRQRKNSASHNHSVINKKPKSNFRIREPFQFPSLTRTRCFHINYFALLFLRSLRGRRGLLRRLSWQGLGPCCR